MRKNPWSVKSIDGTSPTLCLQLVQIHLSPASAYFSTFEHYAWLSFAIVDFHLSKLDIMERENFSFRCQHTVFCLRVDSIQTKLFFLATFLQTFVTFSFLLECKEWKLSSSIWKEVLKHCFNLIATFCFQKRWNICKDNGCLWNAMKGAITFLLSQIDFYSSTKDELHKFISY